MNFLFRGGPQTVEKGREGKGVRIPALAVQPTPGRFAGLLAEHGVQFCHRLPKVTVTVRKKDKENGMEKRC